MLNSRRDVSSRRHSKSLRCSPANRELPIEVTEDVVLAQNMEKANMGRHTTSS